MYAHQQSSVTHEYMESQYSRDTFLLTDELTGIWQYTHVCMHMFHDYTPKEIGSDASSLAINLRMVSSNMFISHTANSLSLLVERHFHLIFISLSLPHPLIHAHTSFR